MLLLQKRRAFLKNQTTTFFKNQNTTFNVGHISVLD